LTNTGGVWPVKKESNKTAGAKATATGKENWTARNTERAPLDREQTKKKGGRVFEAKKKASKNGWARLDRRVKRRKKKKHHRKRFG